MQTQTHTHTHTHTHTLTTEVLVHTLQHGVAIAHVLPAEAPLAAGQEAGAGEPVPGAVGVPGQAALGAGLPVGLTAVQLHLGHAQRRAHVQRLL